VTNEYIDISAQLKFDKKDIALNLPPLYGVVKELYLAADEEKARPDDLYRVLWETGKTGICTIKQLILKDKKDE
jgi:hypothetical protein